MKKSLIICIVIIVFIVVGDIFFQNKIDKTFDYMISKLEDVDKEQNINIKRAEMEDLNNFWEKYGMYFACYIEHAELEKIKSQYVVIKSGLDVGDNFLVHEEISRAINTIELIKEKKILRIDNIL